VSPTGGLPFASASISPVPTDEEAVAVAVALEALWPRPLLAPSATAPTTPAWRFSGRWWAQPLVLRRVRP
jgi:hypothetical protein